MIPSKWKWALIDGDRYYFSNGYLRNTRTGKMEHVEIVEQALGRKLTSQECVHHMDFTRSNNSKTNLVLCPNQKYHLMLHARSRILQLGGDPDSQAYCNLCKGVKEKDGFCNSKSSWNGKNDRCRACVSKYKKMRGYNIDKFNWNARLQQQYRRIRKTHPERLTWLM
jgi:hypothetical protein